MTSPNYIKILKLDKTALKSKTKPDYLEAAETHRQQAKILGVEESFSYFVDEAWAMFGDGK